MASSMHALSALLSPWQWSTRRPLPHGLTSALAALGRSLLLVAAIIAATLLLDGAYFYIALLLLCVATVGLQARADAHTLKSLVELSLADPLTGIGNRRALLARLAQEIARCERGAYSVAILMIDVDKLKQINDRDGHHAGDEALRAVAEAMCRSTRLSDVVGRLGGDEFLVIAPQTSEAEAKALGERIVASARRIRLRCDGQQDVGLSIGVAVASSTRSDAELLMEQADQAMYQAKQGGGNRVVSFGPERANVVLHLRSVSDQ